MSPSVPEGAEGAPAANLTPAMRGYAYLTSAVTGASILIIEILGAKMLSPYFGTSHFVWTAQIAVTLVALAAGYYCGGWLVDRHTDLRRLYLAIGIAAVYLSITVAACEPVAYACLRFDLAAASLLASSILFFVPLTLLAMVVPFLVRILTQSVSHVGKSVGRLTALSTIGSFFGTILIGYVLVPRLPNSVSMYGTALALAVMSAVYFLVGQTRGVDRAVTLLLLLAAGLAGYRGVAAAGQFHHPYLVERVRVNSNFGVLQVLDTKGGPRRFFMSDYLIQNSYDVRAKKSESLFTYMLHLLPAAYSERIDRVLCIGLGVGIVPMQFADEGVDVDVVEINPAVAPLAAEYFDFKPGRMKIHIADGRQFLNRAAGKYDVIVLDAFLGESSPSHLMTREAFEAMKNVLRPGGILVINSFGIIEPGRDFLVSSLDKTLKAVFASVRIHTKGKGNVFFAASDEPLRVRRTPDYASLPDRFRGEALAVFGLFVETAPGNGQILTDDFNPVEFYDAKNREALRKRLALSMRE